MRDYYLPLPSRRTDLNFPPIFWSINSPVTRLRFVQCLWPIVLVLSWVRLRS